MTQKTNNDIYQESAYAKVLAQKLIDGSATVEEVPDIGKKIEKSFDNIIEALPFREEA